MELDSIVNLISSLIISGAAICISIKYQAATKKREDDKMMKDLFVEFNGSQ